MRAKMPETLDLEAPTTHQTSGSDLALFTEHASPVTLNFLFSLALALYPQVYTNAFMQDAAERSVARDSLSGCEARVQLTGGSYRRAQPM